ncbi:hypothetical protein ACQ86N_46675 [Puia sp. P3]|uniref:hypothetical protein n=1 Tax=Puia sp. P3 TaxID=3423952 RepID=UPI003D66E230
MKHEFTLPEGNRYLWNFRTSAGFRYTGKLYAREDGLAGFEASVLSPEEQDLILSMGFHLPDDPAASLLELQ